MNEDYFISTSKLFPQKENKQTTKQENPFLFLRETRENRFISMKAVFTKSPHSVIHPAVYVSA